MITEALAKFVLDTKAGDVPERVYERAGDALIDTLGVGAGGQPGVGRADLIARRWLQDVGALEAYTVPAHAAPVANSSIEGVKV